MSLPRPTPLSSTALRPCRVYQYDINGHHAWFGTGPACEDLTGIVVAEFGETDAEVRHRMRETVKAADRQLRIVR